jgi:hypothetical protein
MASGAKTPWQRPSDASQRAKAMKDRFYATAAGEMAPDGQGKTKPLAEVSPARINPWPDARCEAR